jgi:5-methylcytosine-specific restriction endonuclease McrA
MAGQIVKACAKCGRRCPPGQNRCPEHQAAHRTERNDARKRQRARDSGRDSKHWRQLSPQAREHEQQCRRCGSTRNLNVHLDPAFGGDHRQAELENVMVLCGACHRALHNIMRAGSPLKP